MTAFDGSEGPPEVRLKDLRAGLPPVHVLGRIVSAERREVTSPSDGKRRRVLSGLLSDGTATVRFTWWDPPTEGVDAGVVLRAVNAQVREFRQRAELSFGWSTRVQPASDLELPQISSDDLPLRSLADLGPGGDGFRLEVRVLEVVERTVSVGEERRAIHSGQVADSSGSLPFTSWVDFQLHPGDTVRVVGGYVRQYRGTRELTLDGRTQIEPLGPEAVPMTPSVPGMVIPLGEVERLGTGATVTVEGLIVALAAPSGVVLQCPACGRIVKEGICRTHGAVAGTPDLRSRAVLDDGTSVATVNLDRAGTERLAGTSLAHLLEPPPGPSDPGVFPAEIRHRILGRRLRVRGRVRIDDFGLSIYPQEWDETPFDAASALDQLGRRLAERRR